MLTVRYVEDLPGIKQMLTGLPNLAVFGMNTDEISPEWETMLISCCEQQDIAHHILERGQYTIAKAGDIKALHVCGPWGIEWVKRFKFCNSNWDHADEVHCQPWQALLAEDFSDYSDLSSSLDSESASESG